MKAVILAGGLGTRISEETELKPKPMVEIGHMPILWHIMKCYSRFGYNEFVLALGYKGEIIKNYILNYQSLSQDITVDLKSGNVNILEDYSEDWKITLVDTGEHSMTGSRIKQIEKYIDSDSFFLTYGDGLSNIDIKKELDFHNSHQKIATLVGVNPPSRFGELVIEDNQVTQFIEKAQTSGTQGFINGGFYILNKNWLKKTLVRWLSDYYRKAGCLSLCYTLSANQILN